jgi:hypothetical protein
MAWTIYIVGSGAYEQWGPAVAFLDEDQAKVYVAQTNAKLRAEGYQGDDAWLDGPEPLVLVEPGESPPA